MKKGLLGLLVVALTMVGCQNYDDQFDDLNSKISSLATTVDGLLSVQTTVSALSTKLDNLASTALTDSDLAGILTEVAAVKQSVADLSLADDLAGIETEVADLDAEVDQILEKLNELLTANAVINQNVRITSLAELSLAEDLIATGADDPNVTINGSFIVNTTGASDITAAADVARLNAVMDKIKVVMKTVTVTTDEALTAASLQYIQGSLDINAATGSLSAGALTTVTDAMEINQGGDLLMPLLNSVAGGITIQTAAVTITSVDFSGLTEGAARTGTNELILPNATSVKISGVLPLTVTCVSATTFVSNATAAQTASTIQIDGSTQFSLGSNAFSGQVTITAEGDVTLAGVTSAKALSITSKGAVNLAGLTALASSTVISGTTVNLGSVATISAISTITGSDVTLSGLTTTSASCTLVGPTSVSVPALATLGGNFIATSATVFDAPALATTTGTIDIAAAATVHLKNLASTLVTGTLLDIATIQTLKLFEQSTNVDFTTAAKLQTLDYTGKKTSPVSEGGQTNALTITAGNASLTSLIIGETGAIGTLTVNGSKLAALNTNGIILNTVVTGNADLATFDFKHSHVDGEFATTVDISGNTNAAFTSVNLSSISKVKHVNITGNTSLTNIVAPSTELLIEPTAVATFTITGNLTTGTYTKAVLGTDTTPYQPASLTGETVTGFKTLIDALNARTSQNTVTFSIEIDSEQADMDADTHAVTGNQLDDHDGLINTAKDLLLLTD
jgi:hypothetical protein